MDMGSEGFELYELSATTFQPSATHMPHTSVRNTWHMLRSCGRGSCRIPPTQRAQKGRRGANITSIGSTTSASASTSGQRGWQTPATPEAPGAGTGKGAAAKITNADFAKTVLEPCEIIIQNTGVDKNHHKHFRI
jgi:hypothetical protein